MYRKLGKRLFDIVFSLIVLICLIPVFIVVALLIKLDSIGPVFFIQERMGLNKKGFNLIKFRSMYHQERSASGTVYLDNPEITKAGKWLRRYKIDELPQFINVFIGQMSVVGPRPCLLSTYDKFKNEDTDIRFEVKPGVTSNAGVSGSIFLSWPEKWKKDRYYVESLSFKNDLLIIYRTILVVLLGEHKFIKKE